MVRRLKMSRSLALAVRPVVEGLEDRRLLSGDPLAYANQVQTLPYVLDFTKQVNGIFDSTGQSIGFTRVEANTAGTQYQPAAINLNTAAGLLNITTVGTSTTGSNYGTTNSQVNAIETQFDGTTSGFTITTRLKGPLTQIAAPWDGAALYFGPDQDNYVKLNAEYDSTRGQVLEFHVEQNASTATPSIYASIGSFASLSTLDLRLTGDASTGNVTASYSVNGGTFVSIAGSFQVAASFFTSASRAGIETDSLNNLAPITIPFSHFEIDPGTPVVQHPSVRSTDIAPGATGVMLDTAVTADLNLPNAGLSAATVNATNVQLWRTSDHSIVPASVNTSGGGDSIVLQPANTLLPNTQYTFSVSAGVLDTTGVSFTPYTESFTTGNTESQPNPTIAFVPQDLPSAEGASFTCVRIGPDHKLYASTEDGRIFRWTINADGTLGAPQIITALQTANGGNRLVTGFAFDPSSTATNLKIWVSNSYYGFTNVPDWTGKITVMSGPDLQTVQDAVINLPRSFQDHGTEQPVFGPDGALYVAQGSNSAMGAPDAVWGNRPERLLSAAILRLDVSKLNLAAGPLNVLTPDGGGTYNPYAPGAPLTLYATGVRNAYSLLFTSDGDLYAPTNGSSAGGNTPGFPNATNGDRIDTGLPYSGPAVPALTNVPQAEIDWLFNIQQGGYYGHPDPVRGEYVLDAGNPTGSSDPNTVPQYPVGTLPDPNYRGYAYDFGTHRSPDGLIQYQDVTFGGALQGALLVTEYSAGSDIVALTRDASGNIISAQRNIPGLTDLNNPVDLVEDDSNGDIYVAELGGQQLVLLKPTIAHPSATIDKTLLAFNSIAPGHSGAGVSETQTLTVTNSGTTGLNLTSFNIVNDPSVTTLDASSFALPNLGSVPTSLAPGQSAQITIDFTAPSTGLHSALLQIGTNDTAHPLLTIALRGLGTTGTGGGNEPSLAAILRAYEIPTIVGDGPNDANAFTSTYYPATPDPSSQEVVMPRLMKAGAGPVTITTLASFAVTNQPALRFGYYTPGDPTDTTQLFSINQADSQTMSPTAQGSTSFDPGLTTDFALYANFPTFIDNGKQRMSYSEDALNTWDTNVPRKIRFFPLENPDGSVVPNAYVFAAEDNNIPFGNIQPYDSNDLVGIIYNVKAAPAGPVLGLQNLTGQPSTTSLVFNRIQNTNTDDPAGFTDIVHNQNTIEILNTGSQPLVINSLALSDSTDWQIVSPPAPGTTIAVGGSLNITIKFIATSDPPHTGNQTNDTATTNGLSVNAAGGVWNGTLTINSNDPVNPTRVIQLAGYWQNTSEDENEPGLQTLVNLMYGYGTTISNTQQADFPNNGTTPVFYGEEVNSGLWNVADPTLPVSVTQLASYHSQYDLTVTPPNPTSAAIYWYPQSNSNSLTQLFHTVTGEGQSVYPYASGGSTSVPAIATFNPSGSFGFNIDGENSQNALNTADIALGRSGHAVRFFPVRDSTGHLIPNTFLVVMDYENSTFDNSDFQDNVYLVSNMRPAAQPPTPISLFAVAPLTGGVSLQWAAVSYSPVTYNVYRATSASGPFTKLNGSPLSQPNYIDNSTLPGATYYYRVTAVNSTTLVESLPADAFTTTAGSVTPTAPAAPKGLIATGSSAGILLQWTANTEPDLSGYYVYRSAAAAGPFTLLTPVAISANSYNDTAAPQGATSFYQVVAVDTSALTSTPSSTNATRPAAGAGATSFYGPLSSPTANQQNIFDSTIVAKGGVELGMKFRSDVAGSITGVRFFKGTLSTGIHTGELWSSTGQLLATATFTNETAAGWQQVNFSSPVSILANTTYIVSYQSTSGYLAYSGGALAVAGIDNAPLHALANGVDGGNGVYAYDTTPGVPSFPASFNGQSPSYWVDVVFTTGTLPTAPTAPASLTAVANTPTQIALTWAASTGTVTAYHIERSTDGVTFVEIATSATASYTDNTVSSGVQYTYRVRAENSGAFSGYSPTAQATTPLVPPSAPATLTAIANTPTQVALTWSASTGTVTTYHIERSTDGVTFAEIGTSATPAYTDNTVTAGLQYTYRVRAEGAGTLSGYSPTAVVTTPVVQALTSVDINASQPGSTTVITPGVDYDVVAGGPAIYNTADGFRFLYLQTSGNFDVTVRINSITVAGGIDQAGLMARASLDPSSPEVSVTASPNQGYRFKYRTTQAGTTSGPTTLAATNYPNVWLRLQRVGNLFTGYFSSDGVNWTSAGSITLAITDPLYLGLAAAANVTNATTTVQFRSFQGPAVVPVNPAPSAPAGLGASSVTATQIALTWPASTGTVTAYHVERSTDGVHFTEIGEVATPGYIDNSVSPGTQYTYRVRAENSGSFSGYSPIFQTTTPQVPPSAPASLTASAINASQISLAWSASTGSVTRYHIERSTDGVNFLEIGTATTTSYTDDAVLPGKQYTYRVRTEGAGTFSTYSPTSQAAIPAVQALTSLDINATLPGSTTVIQSGTDYNVVAGGAAIYNNADQFRFLYAPQTGNFDVKVRINSITVAGGIDQAGIMVRTSLDPASPEIAITASPNQGYRFKYRTTQAGATTGPTTLAATAYPNVWVRLQRVGNLFTGYFSSDGINWTSAGSLTLALPTSTFLGLAAAANVANATINVQFRSFEATSLPAPVLTVTAAAIDASHEGLTWNAAPGATSYLVQRKASTDADYLDLVTNVAGTSYTDATVTSGQTYQYRVIAVNSVGATIGLSAPTTVNT